ncbi:hypothetical protein Syun_029576 [Stephania yunnanensis]|uniref:Uncharacterized protein n=1 Tax=Stephania yunnanensis TaxID=152371 RepID=A0AAP0EA98_9MAGN
MGSKENYGADEMGSEENDIGGEMGSEENDIGGEMGSEENYDEMVARMKAFVAPAGPYAPVEQLRHQPSFSPASSPAGSPPITTRHIRRASKLNQSHDDTTISILAGAPAVACRCRSWRRAAASAAVAPTPGAGASTRTVRRRANRRYWSGCSCLCVTHHRDWFVVGPSLRHRYLEGTTPLSAASA